MNYEFITPAKLSGLTECAALTCGITEALKSVIPMNPVLICFMCAVFVSLVRLVIVSDWNPKTIMLALINVFPIYLTASGAYDTLKILFT